VSRRNAASVKSSIPMVNRFLWEDRKWIYMGAWWGGREKPPSTRRTAADGGVGHRTEKALCPGGKLAQAEWFLSIRKTTIFELIGWLKRESAECRLHPLIHTSGLNESSTKYGIRFFRGKVWSM